MREHQPIQIWRIQNHGIGEWDWRLDLLISWSLLMATIETPAKFIPVERLVVEKIPMIYQGLSIKYHPNGCLGMGCVWTVKPNHLQRKPPKKNPPTEPVWQLSTYRFFPLQLLGRGRRTPDRPGDKKKTPPPAIYLKKQMGTLQGINISQPWEVWKIIFKCPFLGDMLVPWRVYFPNPWMVGFLMVN